METKREENDSLKNWWKEKNWDKEKKKKKERKWFSSIVFKDNGTGKKT